MITRSGMASLTMRALAKEASLSVTTLYNLFGAREDIVAALIDDAIDHMDEALEREAPLADPIERCRAVVTVSIRYIHENEGMFRPMLLAQQRALGTATGPGASKREGISGRAARMQSVAIEEAMTVGLLTRGLDPLVLGRQIYHGYELALIQWLSGEVDLATFEARALYGLYIALLGVARASLRPSIEAELLRLEHLLDPRASQTSTDATRQRTAS